MEKERARETESWRNNKKGEIVHPTVLSLAF